MVRRSCGEICRLRSHSLGRLDAVEPETDHRARPNPVAGLDGMGIVISLIMSSCRAIGTK